MCYPFLKLQFEHLFFMMHVEGSWLKLLNHIHKGFQCSFFDNVQIGRHRPKNDDVT